MASSRVSMLLLWTLVAFASGPASTLDGVWRSQGYGYVFESKGPELKAFEVTATTCVPSFTARRDATAIPGREATFESPDRDLFFIRAAGAGDHKLLHNEGSASDVRIDRLPWPLFAENLAALSGHAWNPSSALGLSGLLPDPGQFEDYRVGCVRTRVRLDVRILKPGEPGAIEHGESRWQYAVESMNADLPLDAMLCDLELVAHLVYAARSFDADDLSDNSGNLGFHTLRLRNIRLTGTRQNRQEEQAECSRTSLSAELPTMLCRSHDSILDMAAIYHNGRARRQ
jgi:hypothetical protein